jgi:hypothetical protein
MQDQCDGTPEPVFVVVLREFLVARDIEMIIRNIVAEARVILARTLDEAVAAMPQGRIKAAFVQVEAGDFAQSELGRRVATDGGRTVLVGVDPGAGVPAGWTALAFPFAESDVSALLAAGDGVGP